MKRREEREWDERPKPMMVTVPVTSIWRFFKKRREERRRKKFEKARARIRKDDANH